jgi:hypothetical protein
VRVLGYLLLAFVTAGSSGCHQHRATTEDCHAVLDRLVEIELNESGYRDPILHARWRDELERWFSADVDRCRGRKIRDDFRSCLKKVKTSEQVAQRCLD